jgi:hypothetical protein
VTDNNDIDSIAGSDVFGDLKRRVFSIIVVSMILFNNMGTLAMVEDRLVG